MPTKDQIILFLQNFHLKMDIWGIVFRDDRGKNTQALLDLEISPDDRNKILKALKTENYAEGPLTEKLNGGSDMWVFGNVVKGKEIYIKISMGIRNATAICISFHIAEHKMNYPFREKKTG